MKSKWEVLNWLRRKKSAYKGLFFGPNGALKPDAETVLKDLRKFSRRTSIIGYHTATGALDPIAMANANGRREMYDRIMRYLHLPENTEIQLETITEE